MARRGGAARDGEVMRQGSRLEGCGDGRRRTTEGLSLIGERQGRGLGGQVVQTCNSRLQSEPGKRTECNCVSNQTWLQGRMKKEVPQRRCCRLCGAICRTAREGKQGRGSSKQAIQHGLGFFWGGGGRAGGDDARETSNEWVWCVVVDVGGGLVGGWASSCRRRRWRWRRRRGWRCRLALSAGVVGCLAAWLAWSPSCDRGVGRAPGTDLCTVCSLGCVNPASSATTHAPTHARSLAHTHKPAAVGD